MTDTLQALMEKVRGADTPENSAAALVNGVADQLDALTHDPVAIKALAAELRQNASPFATAICDVSQPGNRQRHTTTGPTTNKPTLSDPDAGHQKPQQGRK